MNESLISIVVPIYNVEDYLNHENITTETDMSGYSTITLNNIKDIKIK